MRIDVLAECQIPNYEPERPTIAIRIFDSSLKNSNSERTLPLSHPNFTKEFKYFFDDIDPIRDPEYSSPSRLKNYFLFDRDMALTMLKDFKSAYNKRKTRDLMVHCFLGRGRSPAIAKAINDIFSLDNDILFLEFRSFNMYVYNQMIEAACRLNLI